MATPYPPPQLVPVPVVDEFTGAPIDPFASPMPVIPTDIVMPEATPQQFADLPPPEPFTDEIAGLPLPPFADEPPPSAFGEQSMPLPWEVPPQPIEAPEIDALSGGALPGQFAIPEAPPEYAAPTFDPTQRDPFDGFAPQEAFGIVENMDPVQLARTEALQNQIRDTEILRRKLEADQENVRQMQRNAEIQRVANERTMAKEAEIEADALELSKRGLDRKRWFKNASTFEKIAAVIGTLVGGLMSKPGQQNQGLTFLSSLIDSDIEDQKLEIENARTGIQSRTNAVAREYQRTGDMHRATETVRLASYQALLSEIQTQQQNFDPRGTSYLEHGKAIQAMQGRIAQAAEERRRRSIDEEIKIGEYNLKLQEREDKLRLAARPKETPQDKIVYTPQQLAAIHPGMPVPPVGMGLKTYEDWIRTQKFGEELKTSARANDPAERARELGVSDLYDEKGQPALFRDAKTAGSLAEVKGKVSGAVALIDQIANVRQKYGWSPDLLKSPEWRQIQADYTELQLTKKDVNGLGVITGPDLDLLGKSLGTKDPTEVRDPLPGLVAARGNMINLYNHAARAQAAPGVKLRRWEPPKPPPLKIPDEVKLGGKTFSEVSREAEPGAIRKALSFTDPQDVRREAEQVARVGPTGLALEDTAKVVNTIKEYRKAKPEAKQEFIDRLTAWSSGNRPSVTNGVLGLLRGEDPDLYQSVLATLPEDVREARLLDDAFLSSLPELPGRAR